MITALTFTPADLITLHHGQPMTTSLKVAEVFGKQHKDVLRKLAQLECSPEFTERNFALSEYTDVTGRQLPMWNMTKNGFIFLVMGFTGKLAAQFKEHYISAFDWMAEQLIATRPAHALTHDELRDLAWCWRAADKMWLLAKEVEDLLYSAKHSEAPNCYSIVREYSNTLAKAKVVLINHTRDLPPALYADEESNWARVLRPLHGQPARQMLLRSH